MQCGVTKRMFPPNQEVHYSWCPKIENARATLQNDINDSPQLLLIHTGTNDLSITTPIVEFIAELSTLITEAAKKFPTSKIIYSTLLPRTDIPIPIITRINEQLITECSRLPNVHLINHANLFAEGIDLLHDTEHIKRRHIGLFAANLIDAIRGRARQTRCNPKVVNCVNRSPRRQVRTAPKNKYSHTTVKRCKVPQLGTIRSLTVNHGNSRNNQHYRGPTITKHSF